MSEFSAPGALAPVISDTWDAPRPWSGAAFAAGRGSLLRASLRVLGARR